MLKKITYNEQLYALDFKTSTADQYEACGEANLWLWSLYAVKQDKLVAQGKNIASLFDFLTNDKKNKTIISYNTSVLIRFINYYLLNKDYNFIQDTQISVKDMEKRTCNQIISKGGYLLQCIMKTSKNTIYLLDASRKLDQKLSDLSDAYGLPLKAQKITKEITNTVEEANDDDLSKSAINANILADALRIVLEDGCLSITQSGDARNKYLKYYHLDSFKSDITPSLNPEDDVVLRRAYRGGQVYLNPKYKNLDLNNVSSYDVNSMYGYVMATKPLPYGLPVSYEGEYKYDEEYPLYIQQIKVICKLKENHIPTVQIHTKKNISLDIPDVNQDYLISTDGCYMYLILTQVDLEMLKEHYDIHRIQYLGGFKFKSSTIMFKQYIEQLYDKKKNANNQAERQHAKKMLNALSGKFGQDYKFYNKSVSYNKETGLFDYSNAKVFESDKANYVPLGAFITSYGRQILVNAAQANYDKLVYADTDSIHIIGDCPIGINIDNKELGAWKYEGHYKQARYLRKKVYITITDDNRTTVKFSGLEKEITNNEDIVNFNTFKEGLVIPKSKRVLEEVPNGCIIQYKDFKLQQE